MSTVFPSHESLFAINFKNLSKRVGKGLGMSVSLDSMSRQTSFREKVLEG
jgi:hypothetical protein